MATSTDFMNKTVFIGGGIYNIAYVVANMDDGLRQEVDDTLGDCKPQELVNEYARRHRERFGEEFSFSAPIPAAH